MNLTVPSLSYYPGKSIKFNYEILDKLNNTISTNITSDMSIHINCKFENVANLRILQDNTCSLCTNGIITNAISIQDDIGSNVILNISIAENNLYLTNSELNLFVTGCPIMSEPTQSNLTCIPCDTDKYNIYPNNIQFCKSCDPDNNQFVKCRGGKISIRPNYWMKITESGNIISSVCPSIQCCQNTALPCDYIQDKDALCDKRRDYESILCSKCIDGYSVSMNAAKCVQCSKYIYFEYLLYPLAISLFWVLYITLSTSDKYRVIGQISAIKKGKCGHCQNCLKYILKSIFNVDDGNYLE